jgi:hypothetical protein
VAEVCIGRGDVARKVRKAGYCAREWDVAQLPQVLRVFAQLFDEQRILALIMTPSSLLSSSALATAIVKLVGMAERHQVPWILSIQRSQLSALPQLVALLRNTHINLVTCHHCQYGVRWRRANSFVCSRIDSQDIERLALKCSGCGGICSRTGRHHIQLQGLAPDGRPWKLIAQPHPDRLCRDLAYCLLGQARGI